ncbi:hypothetical protein K1T73_13345 [Roseovarius sp. SCSIO 43702]|uniref:hypothetical protein n=1 Tax=Roseovarius sp. SCSIO 43702 TaxID=2823043 RepID=UPI001C731980|nr:hypothetical protein [Roseovarius sp. SCSIO 43702]QYX56037.1 hypothetical protein K1T73_13345 [Roseovarius sp. SCSIO 43702]
MTSLPDTIMPDRALPQMPEIRLAETGSGSAFLTSLGWRFIAAVAILAALGVWMMPVETGDVIVHVIRAAFSVGFGVAAIYGLNAGRRNALPEIRIDPEARRVTMIEFDRAGHVRAEIAHDFDALREVVLRDGWMTAHDGAGRRVLSLPVADPQMARALKDAFDLG